MQKVSKFHGIKLSDIPHLNLREQFFNHYHMVKSDEFIEGLPKWKPGTAINTPYLAWHYWPESFVTYLTQYSVLGVESYLPGAVYDKLGRIGKLAENIHYLRNPFSIPGENGTAAKYYKLMPSLYSDEISLPIKNNVLWEQVRLFYREVRNPIFHGMQLDTKSPQDVLVIFELLADIYGWIDEWHNPDDVIEGTSWFTELECT